MFIMMTRAGNVKMGGLEVNPNPFRHENSSIQRTMKISEFHRSFFVAALLLSAVLLS